MNQAALQQQPLYPQLEALPEHLRGELINGRLVATPRPSGRHAIASAGLGMDIGSAYQRGRGGPGGWWILDEPELHLERDRLVVIPDLAGWRRERMPVPPADHRFTVVPDWVCEVLSPTTARRDRAEKMPLYARYAVEWLWLVDPLTQVLESYQRHQGQWLQLANYAGEAECRIPPFTEMVIELAALWLPEPPITD